MESILKQMKQVIIDKNKNARFLKSKKDTAYNWDLLNRFNLFSKQNCWVCKNNIQTISYSSNSRFMSSLFFRIDPRFLRLLEFSISVYGFSYSAPRLF